MAVDTLATVSVVERTPKSLLEPIDSVKLAVSESLNLAPELNQLWDVIDVYPDEEGVAPRLALAHYNDNFDPNNRLHEPVRYVRGTIVDLQTKAVVCDSYGYNQSLPCYEPVTEDNEAYIVQTQVHHYLNSYESAPEEVPKVNVGQRRFDKTHSKLFLGYEGVLIRLFKWNDQVFFSTQTRIDGSNSNWGGRLRFMDAYDQLNGPHPMTLFGNEMYSPYCYQFYVVHNAIKLATSTRDNRIVFVGVKKVWDEEEFAYEDGPYYWPEPFTIRMPNFPTEPSVWSTNLNRASVRQFPVDVKTLNKFMFPNKFAVPVPNSPETNSYDAKDNEIIVDYSDDGRSVTEIYYKSIAQKLVDERLEGGDFGIVVVENPDGRTVVYRLEPVSFQHRVTVTANNPNLYNRFVTEMHNFTKGNPRELITTYPRYNKANGEPIPLDNPIDRQVYWWSIFYDSVAPSYKDEVNNYYNQYGKDITALAHFILDDYPKLVDRAARVPVDPIAAEQMKRINDPTKRRFSELTRISSNNSRMTKQKSRTDALRDLLYNETGPSLYKMITTMRKVKEARLPVTQRKE